MGTSLKYAEEKLISEFNSIQSAIDSMIAFVEKKIDEFKKDSIDDENEMNSSLFNDMAPMSPDDQM